MNVRRAGVLVLLILRGLSGAAADEPAVVRAVDDTVCLPGLVMVGSCGHQDKPQPVLERVIEWRADLFVYLGDNIYGDTDDMTVLRSKYETLGAKREFRKLRREVPVLAIWDDHDYNGFGSWTNLPSERRRMLDLIVASRAEGVMFVSGDVHWGELSRREEPGLYPLYDLTASGITEERKNVEPNRHRVGAPVRQNHVGGIAFDWDAPDVPIRFMIVDVAGRTVLEHAIKLTDLRFP